LYLTTGGGHIITNAAFVPGVIVDLAQFQVRHPAASDAFRNISILPGGAQK
jgi:hypothetical protein